MRKVSLLLLYLLTFFNIFLFFFKELQYLSINQLNELYMEMEVLIQELSETLINELALRDELEFEKELKNSFISILLAVQNKRRQYHVEKKRGKFQGPDPKYLTTVIPYTMENGTPNNQNLQVLIKSKFLNIEISKN